jgi:hypothetical protein
MPGVLAAAVRARAIERIAPGYLSIRTPCA